MRERAHLDEAADPAKAAAFLLAPITDLESIGPATAAKVGRLLGRDKPRIADLLLLLPRSRATLAILEEAVAVATDGPVAALVRIAALRAPFRPRQPHVVHAMLGAATIDLVFFGRAARALAARFRIGEEVWVKGRLRQQGRVWQMAHPTLLDGRPGAGSAPVYPASASLDQERVRRLVSSAVAALAPIPEWLDDDLLARQGWPSMAAALRAIHGDAASSPTELDAALRRLVFDELLANQLALRIRRLVHTGRSAPALPPAGPTRARILDTLPFALTAAQTGALASIDADLGRPEPMLRLLQGDVGSGKTMVALLAMMRAVEARRQAALMAPTELLARQHAATFERILGPLGIRIALVLGGGSAASRRDTSNAVRTGMASIAIGTHALFQSSTEFADLALTVIDEQHRFGVGQRLALTRKGDAPHTLLMSATPIPRSMLLGVAGDMPVSELREKPQGRLPVTTRALPLERLDEVVGACARSLAAGGRIYWICPRVGDREDDDETAAAEARAAFLRDALGDRIRLAHGRLPAAEREAAMAAFARGDAAMLVATTVVEVGVDVPEATVIVVEEAERFGLAQLHQLRGRVGRGGRPGHCLLLWRRLTAEGRRRLAVLRSTEDGFAIAEADLRFRGGGDVLGFRQSGAPGFRLADLARDRDLLPIAAERARLALARTDNLSRPNSERFLLLLRMFEQDDALSLLQAG